MLVLTTDENNNILEVNPFIEELTGQSREVLIGQPAEAIFGRVAQRRTNKDRNYRKPLALRDKEGRIRWIYWNTRELPYFDNRRVCVSVGLDVSEGVDTAISLNTWPTMNPSPVLRAGLSCVRFSAAILPKMPESLVSIWHCSIYR